MPGFIKPQLATLKSKAPKGEQWLHEIKYDGYRVQVHLNRGRKKVYTRNGLDWTKRFSTIAGALDIPRRRVQGHHLRRLAQGKLLQRPVERNRTTVMTFGPHTKPWRNESAEATHAVRSDCQPRCWGLYPNEWGALHR